MQVFDNGSGGLKLGDGSSYGGSVNYTTRTVTFDAYSPVTLLKPVFDNVKIGTQRTPNGMGQTIITDTYRYQLKEILPVALQSELELTGTVTAKWRSTAGATAVSGETHTISTLQFDVTPDFMETILQGSVRFVCGGKTYIDRLGTLYHTVDPTNGAGIVAGAISYQTGVATLDSWTPGATNGMTLQSMVTELNAQVADEVVFRVPIAPVRVGTVQIRGVPIEGNAGAQVSATADSQGDILSSYMIGKVDYQSGVVRIKFGQKVTVTPAVMAEPYYKPEAVFQEGGIDKIIKPRPFYADTIRYNAVGYTYLPLDASILGLDPVRLPSDGRVPIFRTGGVCVVHHTDNTTFPGTPTVGTTLNVGRVRVSYIKVYGANNELLNPTMYTTDLDAGTVTLGSTYSQGTLTLPLRAEHRIEHMALVTDVQINGRLALNRPLTHTFPANSTLVSSALIFGDLQGRVFNLFSQESWTNVWSDSLIGNGTTAQFNEAVYPIVTTNRGSEEEDWALIFTTSTAFRVVGKNVGQIAVGSTSADLSPMNPARGAPYWSLNALGFGGGWSAGNVIRFKTAAANAPAWAARTVLQGPVTSLDDSFQLQARGDIDR